MSLTFTTTRFPLYSCLCALAALVLLAIPGAAQNAATLDGLTLTDDQGNNVPLSPSFSSAETQYTATVPYSVVYVEVAGSSSADDVYLLGTDSMDKQGHQIALNRGRTTTINVEARASGKTTTRYTVVVTSSPASTDAKLDGLAISPETLDPAFNEDEISYTASVARNVSTIIVRPTLPGGASVSYDPADTTPSTEALDVSLKDGENTIKITVTAEDGSTRKTYTITVTRPGPDFDDATLRALRLSHGTLSPTFSSATTEYTASVGNGGKKPHGLRHAHGLGGHGPYRHRRDTPRRPDYGPQYRVKHHHRSGHARRWRHPRLCNHRHACGRVGQGRVAGVFEPFSGDPFTGFYPSNGHVHGFCASCDGDYHGVRHAHGLGGHRR